VSTIHRIKKPYLFLSLFNLFVAVNTVTSHAALKTTETSPSDVCSYAREYITSLEYLRSQKQLVLSEAEGRKLALQVSTGCNGSADRFIKTVSVLTKSGLSANDSIKIGTEFSKKTSDEAETFLAVFKKGFLAEYLDMDLQNALKLARSLSTDFKGDTLAVRKDFDKMVDFCTGKSSQGIELSLPQCGDFAARVAKLGEKLNGGMADSFEKLFKFLTTQGSGPGLTKSQSLLLTEKVIQTGTTGIENFIQAYKYAVAGSGLAMDVRDALEFAKKLSIDLPAEKASVDEPALKSKETSQETPLKS
jgi:hypothetical protein